MGRREEQGLRDRLRTDMPTYAELCLKIVGPGGLLIQLVAKPGQLRLQQALDQQRAEGKPMRAIILKARKLGFSTWVQGLLIHRATQMPNHKALVVAQDNDTAGELFDIGQLMYRNLPVPPAAPAEWEVKPPLAHERNSKGGMKYMHFGEPSRVRRAQGHVGLNSAMEIDSAKEFEAGRGFTYRSIHGSEVAFWDEVRKLTSLLNAVPDEPETLVVLESTANGHNHFKDRWEDAVAGRSSYAPVFAPWHEEPAYRLAFATDEDREEFEAQVGHGPFGEDEPRLLETFGCDLEQLHWRRKAIVDKCESKVEIFHQEYPSSPEEAFLATGKKVFSPVLVARVIDSTSRTDPRTPTVAHRGPELGVLRESGTKTRNTRNGTVEVPTGALWVPASATGFPAEHHWVRVWEHPITAQSEQDKPGDERRPVGQYIIGVDAADGEENDRGENAYHAIQVLNHRTLEQAAEWRGRTDPDEVARLLFLLGSYYNLAFIGVEVTGGYGWPIVRPLQRDLGYPTGRLYHRKALDSFKDREQDRLGWNTDRKTKPLLVAGGQELLREETHGIQSRLVAGELSTYVKKPNGSMGPEANAFADLLMAWLIAQQLCRQKRLLPDRKPGETFESWSPSNPVTGY